nr:calphotin-like [Aegilops tauschii subsp. strangulata]
MAAPVMIATPPAAPIEATPVVPIAAALAVSTDAHVAMEVDRMVASAPPPLDIDAASKMISKEDQLTSMDIAAKEGAPPAPMAAPVMIATPPAAPIEATPVVPIAAALAVSTDAHVAMEVDRMVASAPPPLDIDAASKMISKEDQLTSMDIAAKEGAPPAPMAAPVMIATPPAAPIEATPVVPIAAALAVSTDAHVAMEVDRMVASAPPPLDIDAASKMISKEDQLTSMDIAAKEGAPPAPMAAPVMIATPPAAPIEATPVVPIAAALAVSTDAHVAMEVDRMVASAPPPLDIDAASKMISKEDQLTSMDIAAKEGAPPAPMAAPVMIATPPAAPIEATPVVPIAAALAVSTDAHVAMEVDRMVASAPPPLDIDAASKMISKEDQLTSMDIAAKEGAPPAPMAAPVMIATPPAAPIEATPVVPIAAALAVSTDAHVAMEVDRMVASAPPPLDIDAASKMISKEDQLTSMDIAAKVNGFFTEST